MRNRIVRTAAVALAVLAGLLMQASAQPQPPPSPWYYDGSGIKPLVPAKVFTLPPNAGSAGFTLPPGAPPVSPQDGDIWETTTGIFTRISGVTYQLSAVPPFSGVLPVPAGGTGVPYLQPGLALIGNGALPLAQSTFVESISNPDGTLSVSPTTGASLASLNLRHSNAWLAPQSILPSSATIAGLNLGQGTAPQAPSNGDVWDTTAGLFARFGNQTYQVVTAGTLSSGPQSGNGILVTVAGSGYQSGNGILLTNTGSGLQSGNGASVTPYSPSIAPVVGSINLTGGITLSGVLTTGDGSTWGPTGVSTTSSYSTASTAPWNWSPTINYSTTAGYNPWIVSPTLVPTGASSLTLNAIQHAPVVGTSAVNIATFRSYQNQPTINAGYTGTITAGEASFATIVNNGTNPIGAAHIYYALGLSNGNGVTSGTVFNNAFTASAHTAAAGLGGTVNNYGTEIFLSTGSGAGTTNNYGIHIVGSGGSGGGGTTNNYAIRSDSTAASLLSGPLTLASLNFGGSSLSTYNATTWTPSLLAAGTAGTPAYSFQVGSYEQVGRQVTARFSISLSGWTGSPSGNISITGLPVASTSTTNDYGGCFVWYYSVSGLTALNYGVSGVIFPGTSSVVLFTSGSSGGSGFTAAQAGTTPELLGACFYRT